MAEMQDASVMQGFLEEARSYLPRMEQSLVSLRGNPADDVARTELGRLAHNLRGAGTMVGLDEVAAIAGSLEELMDQVAEGNFEFDESLAELVAQGLVQVQESLDATPVPQASAPAPKPVAKKKSQPREVNPEDIPADLLEGFLQEADEHLQVIGRKLASLDRDSNPKPAILEVRRSTHTIKGAAGMVGLATISQVAHRMEDLLDSLYEGVVAYADAHRALIFDTYDLITDLVAARGRAGGFEQRVETIFARYAAAGEGAAEIAEVPEPEVPAVATAPAPEPAVEPPLPAGDTGEASKYVRVPLDRVDDLTRLISEAFVQRSAFEQQLAQYRREIGELSLSMQRLRRISSQLETEHALFMPGSRSFPRAESGGWLSLSTQAEFDTLEMDRYTQLHLLSRDLAEAVSDVASAGTQLDHLAAGFDTYITRQSRLTSEVQDKLTRLRMVPLATLANRLDRTVRVTSQKRGKKADLTIASSGAELDKAVLERLAGPLEHLLRNAVDHGIEEPQVRVQAGKSERGRITLDVAYEGTEVILRLSDDGAGIDTDRIRREGVRQGYLSDTDSESTPDSQIWDLIFQPGFSTAQELTDISGRGVGMDIVKSTVESLKGTIHVQSQTGGGTTFTVRLPMSMAVTRVLMVSANQELFALPLAAIAESLAVEPSRIDNVGATPVIRIGKRIVPVVRLGEALGLRGAPATPGARVPLVVLRLGANEFALQVDKTFEGREVVVKPLGGMLRRVPAVAGATILGDGRVVLILNPADLMGQQKPQPRQAGPLVQRRPPVQIKSRTLDILIVDDSLSVRRVVANLIRNAGWNPIQAKDGMEAIEILGRSNKTPDAILMDIEMPRMDGFELTAWLRARSAYRHTPILMLTSRAAEKHRNKAVSLGVTEYLIKPFHDEVLLGTIRRRVDEARRAA